MIEQNAKVTEVHNQVVWIVPAVKSQCSSCQASGGCGLGIYQRFFCSRQKPIRLNTSRYNGEPVQVGDEVVVGVEEKTFLLASLFVYLIPLLLLIVTAIATGLILKVLGYYQDWLVALISLTIMVIAFSYLRRRLTYSSVLPVEGAILIRRTQDEPVALPIQNPNSLN